MFADQGGPPVAFFCVLCGETTAQNTMTVTASNIQNVIGQKLATGQVCFQAANGAAPIGF
jgi:hypothetical protein